MADVEQMTADDGQEMQMSNRRGAEKEQPNSGVGSVSSSLTGCDRVLQVTTGFHQPVSEKFQEFSYW
ncbi:hypothetical protein I6F07_21195 [Ensifer sp. IC4062]|nr:hypothetical protein [Ensifer sp. IC4062]MCA1442690.1 hypothetical protein [Ensifer sp. IC4062]